MFEKTLKLGAYFTILFRPQYTKFGYIEISREGKKYKSTLLLTMDQIAEFREHLEWLEGRLLTIEKIVDDNPIENEFPPLRDHDDECC